MDLARTLIRPVLLAVVTALPLFACSDDDPAGPEEPDLSGTYELVSITFQGQPELSPPIATGTFTLTQSGYQVTLTIDLPAPQGQDIQDQGTYSTNNNAWTQESTTTGNQSVGTYTLVGTRFEVIATTLGIASTTVWTKTS